MAEAILTAAAAFGKFAGGLALQAGATPLVASYVSAAAFTGLTAAVHIGLGAAAQAQIPDVETQKTTRKQTRPPRVLPIGGTSRLAPAYRSAA
ncbi:MAG TPA: hypothetical protein VGR32_10140 [Brevundimonas sp.]|jgi:hypothetical protein|uniref:hypothetical protein n=1 Tax=Brevundimonas sp. TaxID=1871086 RepID=UPI002DF0EC60|nr:hypothetical protein [Brevundimonas sp.]